MNAASRLALHLTLAAAAGYAGAHFHLHTVTLPPAVQPSPLAMLVGTGSAAALTTPGAARATAPGYRDAARRASASVVTVYSLGGDGSVASGAAAAVASGVVVDRHGLVVTTSEVATQSRNVVVALPDGTHRPARLLGADHAAGLALLKVHDAELEPIEMAGPEMPAVGDTVLALGDAIGLGPTVTQGIISAIRPAQLQGSTVRVDFIQTDASIHAGNFGGALVDTLGRLVGITVGTVGGDGADGIAFAVPAERVSSVTSKLRHLARVEPARPPVTNDGRRFTEVSFPIHSAATSR